MTWEDSEKHDIRQFGHLGKDHIAIAQTELAMMSPSRMACLTPIGSMAYPQAERKVTVLVQHSTLIIDLHSQYWFPTSLILGVSHTLLTASVTLKHL